MTIEEEKDKESAESSEPIFRLGARNASAPPSSEGEGRSERRNSSKGENGGGVARADGSDDGDGEGSDEGEDVVAVGGEEDDPLATSAYDLDQGEPLKDSNQYGRRSGLPWRSRIESAKEFFNAEMLYRFDLLESQEKQKFAGRYRVELKGFGGGVWTLDLGEEFSVVNRHEDAPTIITMQAHDFLQVVNGELNPQLAILAEKLKISGNFRQSLALLEIMCTTRE